MKALAKYWKLAAVALAIIACILLSARACKLTDKLSVLEGKYHVYRDIAIDADKELRGVIASKEAAIEKITELYKRAQAAIDAKQGTIGHLSEEIGDLEASLAKATTDAERVPILTAEVAKLKEQFSLALGVIAEKDNQIFALSEKYDAQVVISANWKKLYEGQIVLNKTCEDIVATVKRDLRVARFMGRVKSGVVIVAAGYIAYNLLTGKK